MAEALKCTQAFISQIENNRNELSIELEDRLFEKFGKEKVIDLNRDSFLHFMGVKDDLDPEFISIKNELKSIINAIIQKTGLSIEEISKLIYRKKDVIPLALRSHTVTANMAKYIIKRIDKVGLTIEDIKTEGRNMSPNSNEGVGDIDDYFLKEFSPMNKVQFSPDEVDFYIKSPIDLPPKIKLGSILGLKEIKIEEVKFGKLYLIIEGNNSYSFQYLSSAKDENSLTVSYEFPPKTFNEISRKNVSRLFQLVIVMHIQKV